MSKDLKMWLILAAVLTIIGCLVFAGGMTAMKWDFKMLTTVKLETAHHEIKEQFTSNTVNTNAEVLVLPSADSKSSVVCYEQIKVKHDVRVEDGTLKIEAVDTRKWYDHIGVNFKTPKITVYIPAGEYGDLNIDCGTGDVELSKEFKFRNIDVSVSTGNVIGFATASEKTSVNVTTGAIRIEGCSAGSYELSSTTGKITLFNVTCGQLAVNVTTGEASLKNVMCDNLLTNGSTGDVMLENVRCSALMKIERTTGDVKLERCDGGEIVINTNTGEVKGSLLSGKIFITSTSTGKISVPQTITGGRCQISTTTGDIKIVLA